jgi:TonB family protein
MRQLMTFSLVALLHVAAIIALVMRPPMPREPRIRAFAMIFENARSQTDTHIDTALPLSEPAAPVVTSPQIDIANGDEADSAPVDHTSVATTMPPRPDPGAPNPLPALPPGMPGASVVVLVRAQVLEDGHIGDATLAGSCGMPTLDAVALDFIKAHWRFLPATAGGQAVKDWISGDVMFRPA